MRAFLLLWVACVVAEEWLIETLYSDHECKSLVEDDVPAGMLGECSQIYFTKYTKSDVNGTHAVVRDYNFSSSKCESEPLQENRYELNTCTAREDGGASKWTLQTFDAWRVRVYMEPACAGTRTVEGLQPLGFCRRSSTHESSQKLCHGGKLLQYEYKNTANCSGPGEEAGADIFLNGSCFEWSLTSLGNISLRNWGVGGSCPSPTPAPPTPPVTPSSLDSHPLAAVLGCVLLALAAAFLFLLLRRPRGRRALVTQRNQLELEQLQ
ncbi:unnamed protein product [Symbiodinium natans]|uniref:Uncharacterized protein n=1 Tax=Symbiodinium natans TaxID=878477 RepID=A0A812IK79_9DINO|nr:unnamed protein product [Symbiodinium natans]